MDKANQGTEQKTEGLDLCFTARHILLTHGEKGTE